MHICGEHTHSENRFGNTHSDNSTLHVFICVSCIIEYVDTIYIYILVNLTSRLVLHLQYRGQLVDRKTASIICLAMAPGNTLASTKRFRGKCKWLRPWWVCLGECHDEFKTMSDAEAAKFWWSRAFVRHKSRARAKGKDKGKVNCPEAKGKGKGTGKGQESHDLDYSSDSEDEKPQRRHMLIADGGNGEREMRAAEREAEGKVSVKGKGKGQGQGLEWYRADWTLRRG